MGVSHRYLHKCVFSWCRSSESSLLIKLKGKNFKPSAHIKYNAVNMDRKALLDYFGLHPDEDCDSSAYGNDLDVLPFRSLLNIANLSC